MYTLPILIYRQHERLRNEKNIERRAVFHDFFTKPSTSGLYYSQKRPTKRLSVSIRSSRIKSPCTNEKRTKKNSSSRCATIRPVAVFAVAAAANLQKIVLKHYKSAGTFLSKRNNSGHKLYTHRAPLIPNKKPARNSTRA